MRNNYQFILVVILVISVLAILPYAFILLAVNDQIKAERFDPSESRAFQYITNPNNVLVCSYERIDLHGGKSDVFMRSKLPFSVNGIEALQIVNAKTEGIIDEIESHIRKTFHNDMSEKWIHYQLQLNDRRFFITKPDNSCISIHLKENRTVIVSNNISDKERHARITLRYLPDVKHDSPWQLILDHYLKIRSNDGSKIKVEFDSYEPFSINGIKSIDNKLSLEDSEFKVDYRGNLVYAYVQNWETDLTISR